MPHPVIWYTSKDAGAPTLNNAAGSLINVLDACLINGYNLKSVTSITVSGGLATATVSAHGFRDQQIVLVEGATPPALNGRKRVTVTGSNTLTFDATGVPDGSATGSITIKAAPLGWEKRYAGTNKAVYARTAPEATAMVLRIDDTGSGAAAATYARAVMYESMVDVDTGTNPTPTVAQIAAGQYWSKGPNSATAKPWMLIGDDRFFYFFTESFSVSQSYASRNGYLQHAFGDIVSYRASDAYHCLIGGSFSTSPQLSLINSGYNLNSAVVTNNSSLIARMSNQITRAVDFAPLTFFGSSATTFGGGGPAYPSPVDNGGVIVTPVPCLEENSVFGRPVRGHFPGLAIPLFNIGTQLNETILTNLIGTDRAMICVGITGPGSNSTNYGSIFIDIDGPWR